MTKHGVRPCIFCDRLESSKDHVLPEMFGRFRNALTNRHVCKECNSHVFGEGIERQFGRNSAEAIFRLIFGSKAADEAHEVGGDRVSTYYVENDEFKGARVQFVSGDDGHLRTVMPPQVIIEHPTLEVPLALLEEEITPERIAPFQKGATVRMPGRIDETTKRLRAKMEHAGFTFVGEMEHVPVPYREADDFLCRIDAVVDETTARFAAKIAVNFLTVVAGYDFAASEDFRPIRRFARFGEPNLRKNVRTGLSSIELDGSRSRYGDGHILTLDWSFATSEVIAQIALFNRITHQVELGSPKGLVWRNIRSAYHYDTSEMIVKRVEAGRGEHLTLIENKRTVR